MKSKLFMAALATLALASAAQAAVYAPVAVSGFTQDMIIGVGETYATGKTATMDYGTGDGGTWAFTYYGMGWNGTTDGLPTGPTASVMLGDPHTFALAPFGGSNALLIDTAHLSGTLTLDAAAAYSDLSFLVSRGSANTPINTIGYTINYADSATKTGKTGTFTPPNWNDASPAILGARADGGGISPGWNLYQVDVTGLDTSKPVSSIAFTYAAGDGYMPIFAVSGAVVPEPTTLSVLGLGAMALLKRRKRA